MSQGTLLDKVWDLHAVRALEDGRTQLFVGAHYMNEVTCSPAFSMLRERGLTVRFPQRTFGVVDHVNPTDGSGRPYKDAIAEEVTAYVEENSKRFGFAFYGPESADNGIVHVIMPELGITQPGMTICCGDSHTSTHGALGALAFGIGTSQIRDVLSTQTIAMSKPKVRKISIRGKIGKGVYSKDVALTLMRELGVKGGLGYAYEFAGDAVRAMSIEERMTLCNMAIEGGTRFGYVNPDEKTFDYVKGRRFAPKGEGYDAAVSFWKSIASDEGARFDDEVGIDASAITPMVTWGINPGQAIGISESIPRLDLFLGPDRAEAEKALKYMGFAEGCFLKGTKIGVAFIGSCTNGRIYDLREAAKIARERIASADVRALVVPGSRAVKRQAESEGLDKIFKDAGFEWRDAGCSMCLAINPDKLVGRQMCASSSNRNFIGRQGSPNGRTMLMSPAMAAAAAIEGEITDVREYLRESGQ